jgi:undecaprenyl-diphosphatase
MTITEAIIIAIVEGITEFLPISSTGHMILTSACLGLDNDEFLKSFEISIQLGAILAIALMYIKRFLVSFEIYLKLSIAFFPTAVIGFFAYGFIKNYLFSPMVVSVSLIVGGLILILVDRKITNQTGIYQDLEKISLKHSFFIGLVQCISMIPGVSRAGATIIGGVFNGFNKSQATEFSFLLAIPTMFAATAYDLYKTPVQYTIEQYKLLGIGLFIAFVFAWLAVKLFIRFVERHGFEFFGWYRIGIGVLFLLLIYMGFI